MMRTVKNQCNTDAKAVWPKTVRKTSQLQTILNRRVEYLNNSFLNAKNLGLTAYMAESKLDNTGLVRPEVLLTYKNAWKRKHKELALQEEFKRDIKQEEITSKMQQQIQDKLLQLNTAVTVQTNVGVFNKPSTRNGRSIDSNTRRC